MRMHKSPRPSTLFYGKPGDEAKFYQRLQPRRSYKYNKTFLMTSTVAQYIAN